MTWAIIIIRFLIASCQPICVTDQDTVQYSVSVGEVFTSQMFHQLPAVIMDKVTHVTTGEVMKLTLTNHNRNLSFTYGCAVHLKNCSHHIDALYPKFGHF